MGHRINSLMNMNSMQISNTAFAIAVWGVASMFSAMNRYLQQESELQQLFS